MEDIFHQFKVEFKRTNSSIASSTLHKLAFFASDTRTTDELDYELILNDNPEQIFIPTTFLHQYSLDPEIGHRICSPTSVSMILLSYGIDVEPVNFAWDTYDTYQEIFGVWPRVVQNASEYGLDGAVTRYRTWSQAREILANDGRIAMSLGSPLFSGHLVMLAGFNASGNPVVHDPARSNGYAYIFDKEDLSHSWFDKGGIGYTFYLKDTSSSIVTQNPLQNTLPPPNPALLSNYPNPFNSSTTIEFILTSADFIELNIYNSNGELVENILHQYLSPGLYQCPWNGKGQNNQQLSSGFYFVVLNGKNIQSSTFRMILLK